MVRELSDVRVVNGFPWWGTKEDPSMSVVSKSATNAPINLVKLSFDSGDVNLHNWWGDLEFNGETYTGVGTLGRIRGVEEVSDLARTPIDLELTGIPNAILAALLNEYYEGRTATVYHGYRNQLTYDLINSPIIIYRGRMSSPVVKRGQNLGIILNIESRFAQWDRAKVRRYTDEDQRNRYSSDTFFQFITQSVEKKIVWGQPSPV